MKWISHKLIAFAACYTVSQDPIFSLIASAFSTLPDLVEKGQGRLIFQKHKGTPHNPLFWVVALPFLYCLLKKATPELSLFPFGYFFEPEPLFLAITAGVTLHLLADSLSGSGVPFLGNKKIALKLYKTSTLSELASEALSLITTFSIQKFEGRPILAVIGKGKKLRLVACPERLVERLKSYAYEKKLEPHKRFFQINRSRPWQIIKEAFIKAGLQKRVYSHQHRHSDAIERLRQTGNPEALQLHLGHASTMMTMRYLSTLTQEDALRNNQEVSFDV